MTGSADVRERALRLVDLAARDARGIVPLVLAGDPVLRAVTLPYDGQLADAQCPGLVEDRQHPHAGRLGALPAEQSDEPGGVQRQVAAEVLGPGVIHRPRLHR